MVATLNNLLISQSLIEKHKSNSRFSEKMYLAYDIKKGFYIEKLKWFQVILRYLFCCYKSNTHLSHVGFELKKIETNKLDATIRALVNYIINKYDQANRWITLNNKEKIIILKLESQIKYVPLNLCAQYFDKLGYKYYNSMPCKIFTELHYLYNKIEIMEHNVFDEISLFKEKIKIAKKDLKNAKNLDDIEHKREENQYLYEINNDLKKSIHQIRKKLNKLQYKIKIRISQSLKEKKIVFQPSIKNISLLKYAVKSLFWEKLSCLFSYSDLIQIIERNLYSYEKNLGLTSYLDSLSTQVAQIGKKEEKLREEREQKYSEEEITNRRLIKYKTQQRLEEIDKEQKKNVLQAIQEKEKYNQQSQHKLQKINHKTERLRHTRELKYKEQLRELKVKSNQQKIQQNQQFYQEQVNIYNNTKQSVQDILSKWKVLEQELLESLSYVFGGTDRISFYNLVIKKIHEIKIDLTNMKLHLQVLTDILQKEKTNFLSINYSQIILILESIDFNNLSESLTKLEEIKKHIQ